MRREANREIRRRNRGGMERREWGEREGGREIIQGHKQKASDRRLRVRREDGDVADSVAPKRDAAA